LDLDGTLLGGLPDRYGISPAALASVRACVDRGIHIAIVTGREWSFIAGLLTDHEIRPNDEGFPHAVVSDERDIRYWSPADPDSYREDFDWNHRLGAEERRTFSAADRLVESLWASALQVVDPQCRRPAHETQVKRGYVEIKFSSKESASACASLIDEALRASGLPLRAIRNNKGVTLRHPDANKGNALCRVAQVLGIPSQAVLAIGDSQNDVSMLDGRHGFRSATVANADGDALAAVRRAGGSVSKQGFGDGVAEHLRAILTPYEERQRA